MPRFTLLPRKKNTDKSSYGHVLIIAGSRGMTGAALLASRAALEAGAGLVTLAVPEGLQAYISKKNIPEVMTIGLPATKDISFSVRAAEKALLFIKKRKISCVVIGPGLSLNRQTQRFVRHLVAKADAPLVLDADGLNSFKGAASRLLKRKNSLVLTPHAGEFQRLFSRKLPADLAERSRLAKKYSKLYDAVLVVKGSGTLVVYRDRFYRNFSGNPGMAKGGAGDVLSGIIAAFIAQDLAPFEAARWAVYFHGRAGDLAARHKGVLGLLATDIIKYLPAAFRLRH